MINPPYFQTKSAIKAPTLYNHRDTFTSPNFGLAKYKIGTVFSQRVQAQGAHSKMRAYEMPNIRGLEDEDTNLLRRYRRRRDRLSHQLHQILRTGTE